MRNAPRFVALVLATIAPLITACSRREGPPSDSTASTVLTPREGYIPVEGGRVWYRIVGRGKGTPVVLLHGGPGVPSYYLKPLLALADERPVIYYDQLGAGKSDHPSDTSLWNTARFVRELATLRDSLGLREVHLYGHSWGTMLAAAYMETKPAGVKSVTFASPCLNAERWAKDADSLILALPDSVQKAIARNEAAGTTSSPEYQSATASYYARYLKRSPTPSVDLDSANAGISVAVYGQMWGPSEFAPTGSLKSYDATPRLGELTVPVLFTAGEFDEATPSSTKYYASLVPGARFEVIPNAAHMVMLDNPDATIRIQRAFLRSVDAH